MVDRVKNLLLIVRTLSFLLKVDNNMIIFIDVTYRECCQNLP